MKLGFLRGQKEFYKGYVKEWEQEYKDQKKNGTTFTAVRMSQLLTKHNYLNLRVLDLGCGTGFFGLNMKDKCSKLVGVDLTSEMLAKAKKRNYDQLINMNMFDYIASCDEEFDVVIASDIMMVCPNYQNEPIFAAARKVLKDKGLFLFNAGVDPANEQTKDRPAILEERAAKYGFVTLDTDVGPAYTNDYTKAIVVSHVYLTQKN